MTKPACCNNKKEIYNKGAWSQQEDQKLIDYIRTHGEGCWRSLPQAAGLLRCGKSCRLRWINYLRPDLKRGNFGEDEEELIIKLHSLLGNRWSLISGRLPGRTDNEVKNYWNCHLRKKLINMGIDPNNHRVNCRIINQNNVASAGSDDKIRASQEQDYPVPKYRVCGHDHIAEATSSNLGDDHDPHKLVPDLNLDLTLTLTTSSIHQGHQD